MKPGTGNLEYETRNRKPRVRNQEQETSSKRSEIRNFEYIRESLEEFRSV